MTAKGTSQDRTSRNPVKIWSPQDEMGVSSTNSLSLPNGNKFCGGKQKNNEEERRLYQKVFQPIITRKRNSYKKRSVRKTCEELVDSFYPEAEVSYEAMRLRLITQFGRCSRQTILAYLGRPATRQTETIEHDVKYVKSGTTTNKQHTFIHRLPAKTGYVEQFGLARLHTNFKVVYPIDHKKGQIGFTLYHTRQTELDEEFTSQKESDSESFKEALAYAKQQVATSKNFLSVNTITTESLGKTKLETIATPLNLNNRRKDTLSSPLSERKKLETSESKPSAEEKRHEALLFNALNRIVEAST